MSGPVAELERRLALPRVQVIRIRGPPASGKSWLIKAARERGANQLTVRFQRGIELRFFNFSTDDEHYDLLCDNYCDKWWVNPVDTKLPTMITMEIDDREPQFFMRLPAHRVKLLTRRRLPEHVDEGKIVIHGVDLDPRPGDIELPPPGRWSRTKHRALPVYCRRWFRDVFVIMSICSVRTQHGLPPEMIEEILSKLRSSAF